MLINVYKPVGMTSHDVVDEIRRITGEKRVGHAGTLDPFATGVLVVGVGRESTKQLGNISKNSEKEYIATMELGKTSTTGDLTGEITDTRPPTTPTQGVSGATPKSYPSQGLLVHSTIDSVLKDFVGEIEQRPPMYSAIKIKGEPAYKKARRGEKFTLPKRKIKIFEIELLGWKPPFLKIRVVCSSGTYIRSLTEDIGKKLDTGAYLKELVRTRVGTYQIEQSKKLEELR